MVAAPIILLFLFTLVGLLWLGLFLDNDPAEEIRATKRHQFLGPGRSRRSLRERPLRRLAPVHDILPHGDVRPVGRAATLRPQAGEVGLPPWIASSLLLV